MPEAPRRTPRWPALPDPFKVLCAICKAPRVPLLLVPGGTRYRGCVTCDLIIEIAGRK